ncbi:membrane protein [Streptomyces spiroverticillatus]|uniref:Membrane protein n=1 Tax=Streptomyces finlayi TaxID=67296 RepID=A0A918WZD5_9ACTN|nr:MFS transporter [Streptomyces finlayi]GHA13016.1 membrane protein [Streptomyces spiroverticillatus]GHC98208.1 membrane protein [Streptomyces finlayi]
MRTYRELFRQPEFTPLFLVASTRSAAQTVTGLALGVHIYSATGSPLLSSLAMFGPSLAQLIGASTLLSAADRVPPRAALTGIWLVFAVATAIQAIPGLPVGASFAVLLTLGMFASLSGGVTYGLLHEILPKDGFLIGRSVINMSNGATQILGFAAGGLLVTLLSPPVTLLVGAGMFLAAAALARFGLSRRPARAQGRASIAATWRTNGVLWSSRPRRYVYLMLCVPNGLIVGCESLYVPYEPAYAGLLFASAAGGMLVGDTVVGRFVPTRWRVRGGPMLRLLLAAPYLVFFLRPPLGVAVGVVFVASIGFAATLLLQERLLALTPDTLSGHALGLHGSGMLAMQGVGAALAGAVAQVVPVGVAMGVMAGVSVVVTLGLERGVRAGRGIPGEVPGSGGVPGPVPVAGEAVS